MAQEVQIVPKYLHSHVETYINDYTSNTETTVSTTTGGSRFISVFRSSMGIDNVIVKKDTLADFKKTYGKSNFSKYGQPLMMPIAELSSGNASVYCMRIMPDDAYAANSILSLSYLPDVENKKFNIQFKVSSVLQSQFSDTSKYSTQKAFKTSLRQKAESIYTGEPDEETGYIEVPLITFRSVGRGTYGNSYRWRIVRNDDYESNYNMKMYSFEILSSMGGVSKVATYVGSLTNSEKSSYATLINDILDDQNIGSIVVDIQVFEEYVEAVYNAYKTFLNEVDPDTECPSLEQFDMLFGKKVSSDDDIPYIVIHPTSDDSTSTTYQTLDPIQGVPFIGGSDGSFDVATVPQSKITEDFTGEMAVRKAEIDAYTKAFNGTFDRRILSPRRTPCDVLLDANYPSEVKVELAKFANVREDCLCYIDYGTETTIATIDNMISYYNGTTEDTSNSEIFNTRNISKEFQYYVVKDPDTKKRCTVTITYLYAQKLPFHYAEYGSHVPFVKGYSQLTGHIKDSLEPSIDDVDMDIKEKLYKARINYYENAGEDVFQRCSQNTAQLDTSDLMEENNMNTLFELKRLIEMDCWYNLYNFTSAEDRARFAATEKARFSNWEGRKVDSLDITFSVNEWELEHSIVHCYVEVKFRNLNKRTIIEIDVNKRDTSI